MSKTNTLKEAFKFEFTEAMNVKIVTQSSEDFKVIIQLEKNGVETLCKCDFKLNSLFTGSPQVRQKGIRVHPDGRWRVGTWKIHASQQLVLVGPVQQPQDTLS